MSATLFGGVHDFFHSGTWETVLAGIGVVGVVFWVATVFWVWKDARRRIEDAWLVGLATLLGAVPPFLGPLIYMLFRPPEYLDDVRERDLEIRVIESRLGGQDLHCSVCGCAVDSDYLVCPVCTTRLRQACTECQRPLERAWQICPYCETPVIAAEPVGLAGQAARQARRARTRG